MEVNPEKHKNLMVYTFEMFKALETQLLAYMMVLHAMKVLYADQGEIDQALKQALNSPALQQMMNQKYDSAVEMLTKHFDEAILQEELSKWFRNWKPETLPN